MALEKADSRFPCTFAGCLRVFDSLKALKGHKKTTPEHEYCFRCDLDFADEDQILIHKIESNKHIACPLCGAEFKSEGGRNGHIRQFHQAEQNIVCVGCNSKFNRAHALMFHVETNQCEGISVDKHQEYRSQKLTIKAALNNSSKDHKPANANGQSEVDSVDGGVGLPNTSYTTYAAEESVASDDHLSFSRDFLDDIDTRSVTSHARSIKHWPSAKDAESAASESDEEEEDLMEFGESGSSGNITPTRSDNKNNKRSHNPAPAPHTPRASGQDHKGARSAHAAASGYEHTTPAPKEVNRAWNPYDWLSSRTGKFHCPCGMSFATAKELTDHVRSGVHADGYARCPSCNRPFRSYAAVVAHCETATARCKVSESYDYARVMDEVSAGIIDAVGYHADGTVRYQASKKPKEFTKEVNW
ncbi:hypothetical protein AJ80_09875 [Polytolypa hystricis UAMH7299]|uniref:C2H2-type domain-containing protein n=1 Tax=Polytolypa hystricis (strain UAMH7299) TaxID=1447883 RepID=A0A2B7WHS3_POLH7|nr:hypothetical protein AJ80_09875 [Polytolypa hystricis UAMH7299]